MTGVTVMVETWTTVSAVVAMSAASAGSLVSTGPGTGVSLTPSDGSAWSVPAVSAPQSIVGVAVLPAWLASASTTTTGSGRSGAWSASEARSSGSPDRSSRGSSASTRKRDGVAAPMSAGRPLLREVPANGLDQFIEDRRETIPTTGACQWETASKGGAL